MRCEEGGNEGGGVGTNCGFPVFRHFGDVNPSLSYARRESPE